MATSDEPEPSGDDREFVGPGATALADRPEPGSATSRAGLLRRGAHVTGEVLITLGLVLLLFVGYELYVTDLTSASKQADASTALDDTWAQQRQLRTDPLDGESFARLYVPSFGADYNFTVQEGTSEAALEVGPGHYKGTAMPGNPGNFAVAGHRVGKGAPFNDLDLLNSCDAIVVETQTDFFVYRVLPHDEEIADWATSPKAAQPDCAGVSTLRYPNQADGGPYGRVSGRKIVSPDQGNAVAPVPYQDSYPPAAQQVPLLTLTTCHPQFSDRQRLIVHAVLVKQFRKQPGATYQGLLRQIGEAS